MKKIISIILCLSLILGLAVAASAATATEIMDKAYALAEGESLSGDYTLTGKITAINTAYSSSYGNITVTIAVDGDGREIMCYRLSGDGCADLAVGDTITVTGEIKNYYGTIEYNYPTLDKVVKTGTAVVVPDDPKEIVDAAFALAENTSLPYEATLTGKIVSIDTEYSADYGNITVTISVEGTSGSKNLVCYRLKGTGVESLAVGDTITVTGTLCNYQGTIEFTSGCILDKVVSGSSSSTDSTTSTESTTGSNTSTEATTGSNTSTEATTGGNTSTEGTTATEETPVETIITGVAVSSPTTGTAYKLGVNQKTLGEKLYFAGTVANAEYYLATTTDVEEAVDVYLESVDGGYRMYFMDGSTKTYIDIYLSDSGYVNMRLTTAPTAVFTWNSTYNTFVTTVNDTLYYCGAYYSYNTLSASKCSYLDDPEGESYASAMYITKESPVTGDTISVFVALLAVSAMGIAVIGKKKEF